MAITLHWFLTTSGDGRTIVGAYHGAAGRATTRGVREPDIDYLAQQARAADALGFTGVLTPTGTWCEDAWLTTAALVRETRRLKFLVAFRPGVLSPTLAAQMAASYQRLSRGRLLLNVVTGGDAVEQQRFGDWLDHDERYARTAEFLQVVRGAWSGQPFDFTGEHYDVRGATVAVVPDPVPDVYFGGSSEAALPVAAEHADVYLTWGEPPAQVAQKIARVREPGGAARAAAALRHPAAHDQPRPLGRRVGRDRAVPRRPRRRRGRQGAGGVAAQRVRRAAAHARAARRLARVPGGVAQPVGGHRPRARWCGHRAGRQSRGGRRPHRGVPPARDRRVRLLRLPQPRGVVLVRRERDPDPARPRPARRPADRRRRPGRARLGPALGPRRLDRRVARVGTVVLGHRCVLRAAAHQVGVAGLVRVVDVVVDAVGAGVHALRLDEVVLVRVLAVGHAA
nr:LLM class flavin-dependent oxidoreductase [Angustibacter aerolatus]